jgi:hypothetical protein
MKLNYILYGFGILLCLSGVGYLAAQYVKYLSDIWRLFSLLLAIGMFVFMGKYFESLGW